MNNKRAEKLFDRVLTDLAHLDIWIEAKNAVDKEWAVTEKLAFLRNVEAIQRTDEAKRRTWLSLLGAILAIIAFMLALLK